MAINVICKCGAENNVPDHYAGRMVTCNKCRADLNVPKAGAPKSGKTGKTKKIESMEMLAEIAKSDLDERRSRKTRSYKLIGIGIAVGAIVLFILLLWLISFILSEKDPDDIRNERLTAILQTIPAPGGTSTVFYADLDAIREEPSLRNVFKKLEKKFSSAENSSLSRLISFSEVNYIVDTGSLLIFHGDTTSFTKDKLAQRRIPAEEIEGGSLYTFVEDSDNPDLNEVLLIDADYIVYSSKRGIGTFIEFKKGSPGTNSLADMKTEWGQVVSRLNDCFLGVIKKTGRTAGSVSAKYLALTFESVEGDSIHFRAVGRFALPKHARSEIAHDELTTFIFGGLELPERTAEPERSLYKMNLRMSGKISLKTADLHI